MPKIESLTPEQEAQLSVYRDKWLAIGLDTALANREPAEQALLKAYASANLAAPEFVWAQSPSEALKLAQDRGLGKPSENVSGFVFGNQEASWLGFYEFFREVCGLVEETEPVAGLIEYAKHAGWFLPFEGVCFICERPETIQRDEQGRLHNPDGPAVKYRDGWGLYAVHGVRLPADIIENPDSITVKRIDSENNAEIRRVMLERFGTPRYIQESGAKEIAKDDWGKLYRVELAGDEPLVMAEVLNSTPEPDGSIKVYWLRVHPELRPLLDNGEFGPAQKPTTLNAIASTFGLTGEEYAGNLLAQT
jgi:hypothetical protein